MAEKPTEIGANTRIHGDLEGEEDLIVHGRVEGSIRLTKALRVEKNGIVVANVNVKDCIVSGVVVGDVTASDSVNIADGGRMVGDINAPRVIIVAGASFRGRVDMGKAEAGQVDRPQPARKPAFGNSGASNSGKRETRKTV